MKLDGKTAFITGGTSGLGKSIARSLIDQGIAKVYVCGRSKTSVDEIKKDVDDPKLDAFVCDVTDYRQILNAFNRIGPVDILINSAGIWIHGPLSGTDFEQISNLIDINLKGTIYTTKVFLPDLLKKKDAWLINISSTYGIGPRENGSVYAASKWGVRGFTESLELDLRGSNVKVLGVYPGGMKTELFKNAGDPRNVANYMEPDDVANTLVHLITRPASMHTNKLVIERHPL